MSALAEPRGLGRSLRSEGGLDRFVTAVLAVTSLTACNALIGLDDHVVADGVATGGGASSGAGGCTTPPPYVVEADEDDAMWNRAAATPNELLSQDGKIFVSDDIEHECAAVRFAIEVPPGSTIESATLRLKRIAGNNGPEHSLQIQVWNPPDLPPFDGTSHEEPEQHGPAGIGAANPSPWQPGDVAGNVTADVTDLVRYFVNHEDYAANQHIGFLLVPFEIPDHHVGFKDFSNVDPPEEPASLALSYCAP